MGAAVLLGALAGADRTAFGQTLLAHPVVAALLAGALVGDAVAGVHFAVAIALLSSSTLPVGEQGVRDWTSAAVAVPFAVGVGGSDARWGAGLLLACLVAWAGGRVIDRVREVARIRCQNNGLRAAAVGDLERLERLHLGLTLLHPLRGAVVVGVAVVGGAFLLDLVESWAPAPESSLLGLVWRVAPWVGLPVLLRFHFALAAWGWTALGIVVAGFVWLAGAYS